MRRAGFPHRFVVIVATAATLGACTSSPIPDGYTGPIASVTDSMTQRSATSVDIFYLAKIDGRSIDESLSATRSRNYGRGFAMDPVIVSRDVPAREETFTIVGRTDYAAPILALVNKVYEVSGETRFAPEPNKAYMVRGTLGDEGSAVWIEERDSGKLVGRKIEVKGGSTLGFFEK